MLVARSPGKRECLRVGLLQWTKIKASPLQTHLGIRPEHPLQEGASCGRECLKRRPLPQLLARGGFGLLLLLGLLRCLSLAALLFGREAPACLSGVLAPGGILERMTR